MDGLTIGKRARAIRDEKDLSQADFASAIGMTRDSYNNFERDRLKSENAKEPTIKAICLKYGVREQWLRTGEGPVYEPDAENASLFKWAGEVLAEGDDFKLRVLSVLQRMNRDHWDALEDIAALLREEEIKKGQDPNES